MEGVSRAETGPDYGQDGRRRLPGMRGPIAAVSLRSPEGSVCLNIVRRFARAASLEEPSPIKVGCRASILGEHEAYLRGGGAPTASIL